MKFLDGPRQSFDATSSGRDCSGVQLCQHFLKVLAMAMKAWNADAIQSVADDLAYVAQKFSDAAKQMREKQLEELVLQADAAFGVYRSTFMKLAGDVESEFRDQLRAKQMGTIPRWKINQKVVEARRLGKAERAEKGLEQPPKKKTKKS